MGHAFQQTLMDTLIRFNRMEGYNTLWQKRAQTMRVSPPKWCGAANRRRRRQTRHDYGREAVHQQNLGLKAYSGGNNQPTNASFR